MIRPEDGVKTQFTSDNQPSPEAKSTGIQQAKEERLQREFTRELIKELLARDYRFSEQSLTANDGIGKNLVDAFGADVLNRSAGEIAVLVALNRAVLTKDTDNLFKLLNQAFGAPTQPITGADGKDLFPSLSNFTEQDLQTLLVLKQKASG